MKAQYWLLAFFFLPIVFPLASAAPQAPGGLRASVTDNTAGPGPQFVEFRFTLSPDDPNQDVGSYQYNLTVDSGVPIDLGDVSNFGEFYEAGGGFVTFSVQFGGATTSADYWIHAWDGVDEGPASCVVTVDNGVFADYDSCGDLVTPWQEQFCLPTAGSRTGWNFEQGVDRVERDNRPSFRYNKPFFSKQAVSGLNLGADTASVRWDFEIASDTDGLSSRMEFFFSDVQESASRSSGGNFESSGSFSDGYGVSILEDGNDYSVRVFSTVAGTDRALFSDTFTAGITANTYATGYFAINSWARIAELNIGSETVFFTLTQEVTSAVTYPLGEFNFQTFWVVGRHTGTQFLARDGTPGLCISTLGTAQGGGVAEVGLESIGGQSIPGFDGEGGLGGEPEFPGLNVADQAEAMGMETEALALLLGGLLLFLLTAAGFAFAKGTGAGIGAMLGLGFSAALNLFPLWIVVVVFLLAAGALVFFNRGAA